MGVHDMTEGLDDAFIPIVDEDGRVRGVMDHMTADFLASTDPDPTQASLDAAFDGVTRVRLVGYRHEPCVVEYDGEPYEANQMIFDVVRLDVTDPESLAELIAALRITEADGYGHLMSIGDHQLQLWAGDQHVHTLELLYWTSIRRSVWKGDADLAKPRRFADWLVRHGVGDAREHLAAEEQRMAEWFQLTEAWERAMPPSLRPLWPDGLGDDMSPADVDAADVLLRAAVPDPIARVRALYTWFGAGKGPWSGYPSYEEAAEQLLLAYPVEVLLDALDASTDDVAALYGAARLFSGIRDEDRQRCPEPLRLRMLDAVVWHSIRDNYLRFLSAFDMTDRYR
jgi:hypothetical protein